MAKCPNINLPEWKTLVASRGEELAYYLWDKYDGEVLQNEYEVIETDTKVKEVLDKMGVRVVDLVDYAKSNPAIDIKNVNGVADLVKGVIAITEGKEGFTLTEEMVHIATAIIEKTNPEIITEMISKIGNFKIYKDVFDRYKNLKEYQLSDGKPNIRKIKKEAVDQLITELIVNNGENSDVLLSEQDKTLIQKWWNKILNFILGSYRKASIDLFQDVASQIIQGEFEGDVSLLQNDNAELYFQVTDKQKEIQDKIIKNRERIKRVENEEPLNPLMIDDEQSNNWYEMLDDEGKWVRVKHRVTDRVKFYYNRLFKNKEFTDEEKAFNEFKRVAGVKFHSFFEEIHNRYFDSNGVKRNSRGVKKLRARGVDEQIYNKLEKYFVDLVDKHTINGVAPVVLSESIIFDEKDKKGTEAGSIDLLIIDANGKASIVDWKFMTVYPGSKDIAWYKQGAFDIQLGRYKEILRDAYGVKEFGMMRAVPILMDIKKTHPKLVDSKLDIKGISIGSVTPTSIEPLVLIPVSEKTESTGIEELDKLLVKLNSLWKTIGNEQVSNEEEKEFKSRRLNDIKQAIRAAQSSLNILPLVNVILDIKKQGDLIIMDNEAIYKDMAFNSDKITDKEISDYAEQIREYLNIADVFGNVQDTIGELIYNPSMDKEAKTPELKDMVSQRKALFDRIQNETLQIRRNKEEIKQISGEFADKFVGRRNLVTGLLDSEAIVKGFSSVFDRLSDIPLASLQILYKLVNNAKDRALRVTLSESDELIAIRKKIVDQGGDVREKLKKIYQSDSKNKFVNKLIYKYDKSFYEEVANNAKEGNRSKKWIEENVDMEAYNKESLKKINEKISYLKRLYVDDREMLSKLVDEEFRKWDISRLDFNGWNNYLLKRFPKDKWISKEYLELQKDPALLELYNFITKINEKAADLGYLENKVRTTFLPFVKKGLAESIAWDMSPSAINRLADSITINAEDVGYGKINEITKEVEYGIPKYYTYDFSIREDGTNDYSDVSEDLFKNMLLYVGHLNKYDQMVQIEGQLKLVKTVETFKNHLNTSKLGRVILEEGKPEEIAGNEENTRLYETFLRGVFYGEKYPLSESDSEINIGVRNGVINAINKVAGKPILSNVENHSPISLVKTMDEVNKLFQLKVLGLDVITGAVNAFGFNVQLSSQNGHYFNYSETLKNQTKLVENRFKNNEEREMFIQLVDRFMPLKDDPMYERLKKAGLSKLTQQNFGDLLMGFMRVPEQFIEKSVFLTLLDNTMVVDGKLINIREYVKGKHKDRTSSASKYKETKASIDKEIEELKRTSSITAIKKLEDGKLVIPGLNLDDINETQRLTNLTRRITRNATGNMSEVDRNQVSMSIWYKSMMVFKNWIPPLLKTRFSKFERVYDDFSIEVNDDGMTTGEKYDIGRIRLFGHVLLDSMKEKSFNILNILSMNEKGILKIDEMFEEFGKKYEERTGKEFTMTKDDFADMIRTNLRNQTKELLMLMTLTALSVSMGMLSPDDDDDRASKNAFRYAQRVIDKFQTELSFFYDPREFNKILSGGGILPAIGLFTDIYKTVTHLSMEITGLDISNLNKTAEEVRENAHPIKNTAKMFPVTNVIMKYGALISDKFADEFDITVQKETRK